MNEPGGHLQGMDEESVRRRQRAAQAALVCCVCEAPARVTRERDQRLYCEGCVVEVGEEGEVVTTLVVGGPEALLALKRSDPEEAK